MSDTAAPPRPAPRPTPPQAPRLSPAGRARRFATLRTVAALMLREMSTTHGRSPGGYLWAVLDPVGGIVVLTVVFSLVVRAPALGSNFPLFYATGYLPFMVYNDLATKIMQSIAFSRPLLAYPGVTWADAVIGRFALNLITHLMVFCIVIGGIVALYETGASPEPAAILDALAMAALLGLGVGTLNCFLFSMFPLWAQVWSIAMRPLFLISGVFFLIDGMPGPVRDLLWWNPLIHVVSTMRAGFYPGYDPAFVAPLYVYGVALGTLVLGLVFLGRWHREILNGR